jgi:hypothetical protein
MNTEIKVLRWVSEPREKQENGDNYMDLTRTITIFTRYENEWRHTSISPYIFMAWCLVKQRDNFNFTYFREIK